MAWYAQTYGIQDSVSIFETGIFVSIHSEDNSETMKDVIFKPSGSDLIRFTQRLMSIYNRENKTIIYEKNHHFDIQR